MDTRGLDPSARSGNKPLLTSRALLLSAAIFMGACSANQADTQSPPSTPEVTPQVDVRELVPSENIPPSDQENNLDDQ